MAKDNKSRYAILGLLSMHPMSGYQLRQTIERSIGNFWAESYGQIYPILNQLVADGLATRDDAPRSATARRHMYAITPAGRALLRQWLAEPVAYQTGRLELLLKLFLGHESPPNASREHVLHFQELQQSMLARYTAIEAELQDKPGAAYSLMTIRYGLHITRAQLAWCAETLAALERIESALP